VTGLEKTSTTFGWRLLAPAPVSWFHLLPRPPNHFPHHGDGERMPLRPFTQPRTRDIEHLDFMFLNEPHDYLRCARLRDARRIQHDVRLVFPPTHIMCVESPTAELENCPLTSSWNSSSRIPLAHCLCQLRTQTQRALKFGRFEPKRNLQFRKQSI
jgi:hypothetical protein